MSYLEERIIFEVVIGVARLLWFVCKLFFTIGVALAISFALAFSLVFLLK